MNPIFIYRSDNGTRLYLKRLPQVGQRLFRLIGIVYPDQGNPVRVGHIQNNQIDPDPAFLDYFNFKVKD